MTLRGLFLTASFAGAVGVLGMPGDVLAGPKPSPKTQDTTGAADALADADIHLDDNTGSPLDRTRQGVVLLEHHGKPFALGTVLRGDGRIITALSSVGHGNDIDARFADGSVSRVRVGHSDRAWDLALLIPQNGRWRRGLRASLRSPADGEASLRAFSLIGNQQLMLSRTLIAGSRTLRGGDSELLRDALELTTHIKASDVGSPILDSSGDVLAIVARACVPAEGGACVQVPFGVPVSVVRGFLHNAPPSAALPVAWLGIRGTAGDTGTVRGVRVLDVNPTGPAAAAGVKGAGDKSAGDLVVAVNGLPVTSPEQLATQISGHAVGDGVVLLLFGGGKYRQVSVTLRASPSGKYGGSG